MEAMAEPGPISFAWDGATRTWVVGEEPDSRIAGPDLEVLLYGTATHVRSAVGAPWQPYSNEALADLIVRNGPRTALLCDGTFLLAVRHGDEAYLFSDFFGAERAFYRNDGARTCFHRTIRPDLEPDAASVSAALLAKSGYTEGAETGVAGLWKTLGAEYLVLDAQGAQRRNVLQPGERFFADTSYEAFERLMAAELERRFEGLEHAVIQFSGGMDSTMVAQFAAQKGIRSTLLTTSPVSAGHDYDPQSSQRAVRYAKRYGATLFHFFYDADDLARRFAAVTEATRARMPFSRHHAHHVVATTAPSAMFIEQGERTGVFNGQNSDSVLALGPTEIFRSGLQGFLSGSKGVLSRLFLYIYHRGWLAGRPGLLRRLLPMQFRSEPDFLIGFHYTAMGYLAVLSSRRWRRFFPGHDLETFRVAFEQRLQREYPGFSAWEIMYHLKLNMFLQGGDMQVVVKSHEVCGLPLKMPFKSIDLFLFFMAKPMTFRDVLVGKRYVKRYSDSLRAAADAAMRGPAN